MTVFAIVVSFLLNPLVVSVPGLFLLIYRTSQDAFLALKWTLFSLLFVSLVALFVVYGVMKGFFPDLDVSRREKRPLLFSFVIGVSVLYFFSTLLFNGPRVLLLAMGDVILGVFLMALVNLRVKASGHVAVVSAFALALSILYGKSFLFLFLLIPLVAWSRVVLKKHTVNEVVVGGALGGFVVLLTFIMVKYLL